MAITMMVTRASSIGKAKAISVNSFGRFGSDELTNVGCKDRRGKAKDCSNTFRELLISEEGTFVGKSSKDGSTKTVTVVKGQLLHKGGKVIGVSRRCTERLL